MTAPINADHPFSGLSVAAFLRERQDAIIEVWAELVRALPNAQKLDPVALVDHIPELLRRIAEIAEALAHDRSGHSPDDVAEHHALVRLEEGYDLGEVVLEYSLLRDSICQVWGSQAAPMDISGLALISRAIDRAIAASVHHFVRARDRTLQALDRVATAALESDDLEELLEELLRVLVETTVAADAGAIYLREGEHLQLRAAVGPLGRSALGPRITLGEGFIGRVAARARAEVLPPNDFGALPAEVTGVARARALYAVPLVNQREVVGVAQIASLSAFDFSNQDKRLVNAMASRATAAITQHMLREIALLRARGQRAQSELGLFALSNPSLEQLFERTVRTVADVLGTELALLGELTADRERVRVVAGVGWNEGVVGHTEVRASRGSLSGFTLLSEAPVILEDARTEDRFTISPLLRGHGVVSGMCVAIHARGPASGPYGVLGVHTRRLRTFSDDDASFLQIVANILAAAIERTRTERALAGVAAQRAEERAWLETVIDNIPVGVVIAEAPSGRLLVGNHQADVIWRRPFIPVRTVEEYRTWIAFRPGTDERIAPDEWAMAQTLRTGEVTEQELEIVRGDGTRGVIRNRAAPVHDEEGRMIGAVAAFFDVSEERRIEAERERLLERLVETRSHLEAIVRGSPLPIIGVDAEQRVTAWNPAAEQLFGWREAEVLGQTLPTVPEQERTRFEDHLRRIMAGEGVVTEVRRRRRDGTILHLSLWATPRRDAHGRLLDTIGVLADMTETRRAREELERALAEAKTAVRTREDLLAIVSHDLRNPLGIINLNARLLSARVKSDPKARKALETLFDASSRMERLIADLLDMANIQSGTLSLELHHCEIGHLLEDALAAERERAADKSVRITHELGVPATLQVRCDRERLLQVFGNVIGNAVKFSQRGDSVHVKVTRGSSDHIVQVEIRDTGPGIPPEELDQIFQPYWTAKRRGKRGTGLGLYISRGIIEAHGGRMWVESELGVGSAFFFTLATRDEPS